MVLLHQALINIAYVFIGSLCIKSIILQSFIQQSRMNFRDIEVRLFMRKNVIAFDSAPRLGWIKLTPDLVFEFTIIEAIVNIDISAGQGGIDGTSVRLRFKIFPVQFATGIPIDQTILRRFRAAGM